MDGITPGGVIGAARRLPFGVRAGVSQGVAPGVPRGLALGHAKSFTDLRAMSLARGISADLRITTAEGDVVTLHAASSLEVSYASLRQRQRGPDGATRQSATLREVQLTRETSMTVEGDLSDEELADIRRLVEQIEPLLAGFGPREGAAFALSLDASAFDSLSGFRLDLERTTTMTRLHVRQRTWGDDLETSGIARPAPGRMPVSLPPADDGPSLIGVRPAPEPMPAAPAVTGSW